ncbi:MAG TPA: Fur family transcriptional regulator [Kouleothrix sp.]|uniref:Fur family transcriptional regulator n=1 Tax=Kouleothrix sp. TaxID=2779161 RepID=UPI002C9112BA|nr:Fur family transcriptional regulator [Kouleothrix sp.]HRC76526.1 Fur family transcriptional regulator [Kouleothrix sp.]
MAPDLTQLNSMLARLEAAGKRVTPQRAAVCAALLEHGGHPTAGEVWSSVQSRHPSMSQATVYNTLAALEDLRLIRALDIVGEDHTHYDICVAPHVNVVCTRCGQIADVHTDTLEALLGLVAARSGYRLVPQDGVIVYGLCHACAARHAG